MIPKILHFCFGMVPGHGDKPWSLVHYVCVRSAIERIKPDRALLYYQYEPTGPWWRITRKLVTPVKVTAPREVFGHPLSHPAHRADVLRLEKLLEHGGIYLDCDVLVRRPFDDLLGHSAVLGEEVVADAAGRILCNAVILAEPGAPFLRAWYDEYRSFRSTGLDEFWDEHSCRIPMKLARQKPELVTVLPPEAFFSPGTSRDDVDLLFNSGTMIDASGAYAHHLWGSIGWKRYLENLTPGRVRAIDSNFHRWSRQYVADLADDYGGPTWTRRANRALRATARPYVWPVIRRGQRLWTRAGRMFGAQADDATAKLAPEPPPADRREAFRAIYRQRLWGFERHSEFHSGPGSRGHVADDYVHAMVGQLSRDIAELGGTAVLVDLGCGDFAVARQLLQRLHGVSYVGCDIVPELITHNHRNYATNKIRFRELDAVTDRLPDGDICLVRQVFQHLSNADISAVLPKLRKFRHVYVTESHPTDPDGRINPDKPTGQDTRINPQTGRGSGVQLDHPPWNLPLTEICRTPRLEEERELVVTYRVDLAATADRQVVD